MYITAAACLCYATWIYSGATRPNQSWRGMTKKTELLEGQLLVKEARPTFYFFTPLLSFLFFPENYQYTVPESLPVQSVVARVKAADADIGSNAEMDFRIMDGDGPGMFNITTDEETQDGIIILLKVMLYSDSLSVNGAAAHLLKVSETEIATLSVLE